MVTNVPKQGIDAYMKEQVGKLVPPNFVWKLKEFLISTPMIILYAVLYFVAVYGDSVRWLGQYTRHLGVLVLPGAFIAILVIIFSRAGGAWRRYSIYQAQQRYFQLVLPLVFFATHTREKGEHTAEFEIAVLEQGGRGFGAILIQVKVNDSKGTCEEKPLMIVDRKGRAVQFGEAHHLNFAH